MNVSSSLRNVEEAMGAMRSLHQLLVHRFIEMHGPGACETLLNETTRLRDEIISEIRHRSAAQQPTNSDAEFDVEYDPDDVEEIEVNGVRKPKLFVPPLPADIVAIVSKRRATLRDTESKASCPICQEDYCYGQWVAAMPVCAHEFCEVCCQQWLSICGSCPTCRRVLSEADFFPAPPSEPLAICTTGQEDVTEPVRGREETRQSAPSSQPTTVDCPEIVESSPAVTLEACAIIAHRAVRVRPSSSPSALTEGSQRKVVPQPSSLRDHQYSTGTLASPSSLDHAVHSTTNQSFSSDPKTGGECSSRSKCVSNLRDAVQRDAVAHLRATNSAALGLLRPTSASSAFGGKLHANATIGTSYSVFGIPQPTLLLQRGSRPVHTANPTAVNRSVEQAEQTDSLKPPDATSTDQKIPMARAFLRPTSAPQRQPSSSGISRRPFELAPQASQLVIQQKVQPPRDTPASYVASEAHHDKPPRPSSGANKSVQQNLFPLPKPSTQNIGKEAAFSSPTSSFTAPRRSTSASRSQQTAARLFHSTNNAFPRHSNDLSQGLMIGGIKLNAR